MSIKLGNKQEDLTSFLELWQFNTEQHIAFMELRHGQDKAVVYGFALAKAAASYIAEVAPQFYDALMTEIEQLQPTGGAA